MQPAALDLSFSTLDTGAIPDSVSLIIQDIWTGLATPGPVIQNMQRARDAGKRVGSYCAVNPDVPDNVANALLWRSPEFCALDVEYYASISQAKLRSESDRMHAARPEWPRIIYTSREEWNRMMGGDTSFAADHFLWDARPGDNLPFVPYGGWTEDKVIGVQRTSTITLGTMDVDLDDWRFDLMDAATETRLKMAAAALNNDMNYLVALLVIAGVLPQGTTAQKPAL